MKIAITGANGLLGQELQKTLAQDHEVVPFPPRAELDLASTAAVRDYILTMNPDLIIHAAASRDLDPLETDKKKALRDNCLGTFNVVTATREIDCPLVHISSDAVFPYDREEPYSEFDEPSLPLTVYGWSKYISELIVQRYLKKYFIVRLPWLFGRTGPENKNWIINLVRKARAGQQSIAAINQWTSVCYCLEVAKAIGRMIQSSHWGVYHIASPEPISRAGFQQEVLKAAGLDPSFVRGATIAEMARPAKRVHYVALISVLLEPVFGVVIPHWREALPHCIAELNNAGYL
jgi:dTDP-4-dehydrorhamnose reductase